MRPHLLFAVTLLCTAVLPDRSTAQNPSPVPSPEPTANPVDDVSARSRALDIAGAFSNDGFLLRDGYWPGELEPGRPRFLEVNLFSDNSYWFCAAASPPARSIALSIFDENGNPVPFEPYADEHVAAAGLIPQVSGRYILKLEMLEGEKAPFCVLYSYK
jgi:hypothetical protein